MLRSTERQQISVDEQQLEEQEIQDNSKFDHWQIKFKIQGKIWKGNNLSLKEQELVESTPELARLQMQVLESINSEKEISRRQSERDIARNLKKKSQVNPQTDSFPFKSGRMVHSKPASEENYNEYSSEDQNHSGHNSEVDQSFSDVDKEQSSIDRDYRKHYGKEEDEQRTKFAQKQRVLERSRRYRSPQEQQRANSEDLIDGDYNDSDDDDPKQYDAKWDSNRYNNGNFENASEFIDNNRSIQIGGENSSSAFEKEAEDNNRRLLQSHRRRAILADPHLLMNEQLDNYHKADEEEFRQWKEKKSNDTMSLNDCMK